MALQFYDGPAGQFNYDDTQFAVSGTTGLLRYIGSETRGENIVIPYGIKNCTQMFSNSIIVTPPEIPNGVEDISMMFSGCKQLQHYPNIPSTVRVTYGAFQGSTFDPRRNTVPEDPTISFINQEMNNEIDEIVNNFQAENISIEQTFAKKGDLTKANTKLINNELRARLAICSARLESLKKEENHLNVMIEQFRRNGAPVNYMEDTLRIKNLQISNVEKEMDNIRQEMKYRNPSVIDILKANAIEHKQNLISIGQRITNSILNKVSEMRHPSSGVKGNIYRASEVSQLKYDLKTLEAQQKINEKDIEKTANLYNKLVPGICAVSSTINNMKESLHAFKAKLTNEEYVKQSGLTETGKKLVNRMYETMATKLSYAAETEGRMEKVRLKLDTILYNLSPTERRHSIDVIQNISQRLSEITQSARDASHEKITSYEKIREAQENNHVTAYEKEMTAEEISDRYPEAVRSAQSYSVADYDTTVYPGKNKEEPIATLGLYLFNELPHQEAIYTQEEMNKKFDDTLNNISSYSSPKDREILERTEEHTVHVKEDHAEVLVAQEEETKRPSVMDTAAGQRAMQGYQEQSESSGTHNNEEMTTGSERG